MDAKEEQVLEFRESFTKAELQEYSRGCPYGLKKIGMP